jgi:aromatic-L-amino-acid decarboxylase
VEEVATDWVRQMVGLSPAWSGVIQDTASTSTLVALLCARERATDFGSTRGGLAAEKSPLVVYTSAHSHSSVSKAALLAGYGRDNLRLVDHDAAYAMRPEALEAAIRRDLEEGRKPCAVAATVGTTTSTALDPLEAIAAIAARCKIWMHVDAALAGSAMILPECRSMWQGVEGADSLVLNVHKWLGVAFDCSLYYVRSPEHLVRVMSSNPSYLQTAADAEVKNLRLLAPVPLQTLCIRHEPEGLSEADLDRHTLAWANRINRGGQAYLTPAILDDRWMVRISIGALPTEREHVEALWRLLRQEAEKADE